MPSLWTAFSRSREPHALTSQFLQTTPSEMASSEISTLSFNKSKKKKTTHSIQTSTSHSNGAKQPTLPTNKNFLTNNFSSESLPFSTEKLSNRFENSPKPLHSRLSPESWLTDSSQKKASQTHSTALTTSRAAPISQSRCSTSQRSHKDHKHPPTRRHASRD